MVPLEVTHTALATPAVLERMFHKGSSISISPFKALVELLLTFFESTYRQAAETTMSAQPEVSGSHTPCWTAVAGVSRVHSACCDGLRCFCAGRWHSA